jgi:hypothetical protein
LTTANERCPPVPRTQGGVLIARLSSAALLAAALVSPLAGQVSVKVVDQSGRPVPAVRIDVLGLGDLIGTVSTTAEGTAELSFERWSEARRLTLTHLEFRTLIVQVDDIPSDGLIRLEPEATAIEGLDVTARPLCPIDDDDRARRLWSEVASRYSSETPSRAWFARLSRYGGSVREQDLHRIPDSGFIHHLAAGGPGVITGDDHTPRSLDDRIESEGYAWRPLVVGGTTRARDLVWAYPELDWLHAYHFASPVFGALHHFAVASESEGQITLVFCANGEGSGATIDGVLSLAPEEAFLSADWRFDTTDRDESAGGSVAFTSYAERPGAKPHLLASRGAFFRHTGPARPYPDLPPTYARFGTASIEWYLLPSAERPCNTGISFRSDPPRSPEGMRFHECVAEYWRRE